MSHPTPMVPLSLFTHISVATEPPPITHDVEVMTELFYTDPPHSENDPTVPTTSLIPLVNAKDLVTNIIGVKVSAHSETVKWSSRFTTVLALHLEGQGQGIPDPLRQLDHGIGHGWNQTTTNYPIQDKVHPDNFLLNGWSLLHQSGVLTDAHQDSDGGVTFVQLVLGKKNGF
ncbi:hypothetical protein BDR03DRAFT_984361 [Suillus americanus]|nr:hypothetical protein BDR03DRAFT_984361 [Suillus americanus]